MKHRLGDEARLKHIRDAIQDIEDLIKDLDKQSFLTDKRTKYACVFQLEVIGEASNHLSEQLKTNHATINWIQVVGLRNIIAHKYFGIDYERIWDIVITDLPMLKNEIDKIIEE